ncbi:MAG: EAL domain-containing protein [Spirochaetia bacterium]|jgi:diguanylate cyclase (GGDEF)-like protein
MPDKYEYIVNNTRDFHTLINRDFVYEIANDAYCAAIEKTRDQIVGRTVADVWGKDIFEGVIRKHLEDCFADNAVEYIERFKFGSFEKQMHVTYLPFSGTDGAITHAAVCSHDITHISQIESKLTHYEFRDPTTGLFNRKSLDIILEKEIAQARRSTDKLRAVLFISIENLGKVNEAFSVSTGDLLLENTGLRIQKCLRASDFLFRFVGNELTCLLCHLKRPTDAARVAEKIAEQVKIPYHHQEGDIRIGCCIGVAFYPDDGDDAETVIRNAGAAMRQARRNGQEYYFYNPATHHKASEKMVMESDMLHAFEKEQFHLVYQPIVDAGGRVKGAEALIRWMHPEKGLIPPNSFIPLAEETGIIRSISKWALYAAAEQLSHWSSRYGVFVTVNLSAEDFRSPELPELLTSALRRAGVSSPGFLKLEITESQCMIDPEGTVAQMKQLTDTGFDLFIDDFGTGSSSLGWLKRLPAGTIKIDRLFVDESMRSPEDFDYLASIVALARSRRKSIILEGIGTQQQFDLLKRLNADGMQGFHFSKPLAAEELDAILSKGLRLPLVGAP